MSTETSPISFVDTNVFVYALASDDDRRSAVAQDLLRELTRTETLRTSTQVLQELFVTLTRKVRTPMSPQRALRYLDQLAAWPVIAIDYGAIRESIELSSRARTSFWDALIVIAAVRSGAKRLYTENLNDKQIIHGLEIVNPFRDASKKRVPVS